MKQSLTKLVDVILRRIEEKPETVQTESGIRSWLAGQGYNRRDIDAAMRLVGARLSAPLPTVGRSPDTLRRLSVWEELKLQAEARDALVRLDLYELISPVEREMILDQLQQFEGEVGLPELDYLISWVCSDRNIETQQTLSAVIDGQGGILH